MLILAAGGSSPYLSSVGGGGDFPYISVTCKFIRVGPFNKTLGKSLLFITAKNNIHGRYKIQKILRISYVWIKYISSEFFHLFYIYNTSTVVLKLIPSGSPRLREFSQANE